MTKEKTTDETFYAITEQGDLGLGLDVLGLADQKILSEQAAEVKSKKSKK